jgi:hypothetical protein
MSAMQETANKVQKSAREESEVKRAERIPMGGATLRTNFNDIHGKYKNHNLRWFNDDGDRLFKAKQAGYEFVTRDDVSVGTSSDGNTDNGNYVSITVGSGRDNRPMRSFLMAIPLEYYREDQKAKQKLTDEIDRQIKEGAVGQQANDMRFLKTNSMETSDNSIGRL